MDVVCFHSFNKSLDLKGNWPVADRPSSRTIQEFNDVVLGFSDALWRNLLFVEERQTNFKSLKFSFTKYVCVYVVKHI